MPTRHQVDLTNLQAAIDDILVHYKVIKDDNYSIIVSHDGSRVFYDKEHPRTEVYITDYCESSSSVASEVNDNICPCCGRKF